MGCLYKKTRVTMNASGRKIKRKEKKWWGKFRDASGIERRVPLCNDKQAAATMLADKERQAERQQAGLYSPSDEQRKRPLSVHVAEYGNFLSAKGGTTKHTGETLSRINKVIAGCKFARLGDLNGAQVLGWLEDQRRPDEKRPGWSIRTSNATLTAIKGFTRWLQRERRLPDNPLAYLAGLNDKVDVRRDRRPLTQAEVAVLLKTTQQSAVDFRGLSGGDRAMLYLVALNTGLRAAELASLTADSFDINGDQPTVAVEAGYSKHRRRDVLPLRADMVEALRPFLASHKPAGDLATRKGLRIAGQPAVDDRLWPGTWSKRCADMLDADMVVARAAWLAEVAKQPKALAEREKTTFLCKHDDADHVVDFHCLRHGFISALVNGGASPKVAQLLARHSTIVLTMDRYAHVALAAVVAGLDALPAVVHPVTKTGAGNPGGNLLAASGGNLAASPCIRGRKARKAKTIVAPEKKDVFPDVA